jgi:hypothetical protein
MRALPSLGFFEWGDNTSLSTPFITALAHSSVNNLIISNPLLDDEVSIHPLNVPGQEEWPLRDLRIDLRKASSEMSPHTINSTSALCASILRRCAPTLENLIWRTTDAGRNDPQSFGTDPSLMPYFSRLQRLELDESVVFADTQTLNAVLKAPIRYLVVNTGRGKEGQGEIKKHCFRTRGCIPTLESFVWTHAELKDDHSLDFLRENSHLRRLCISHAVSPPDDIEGKLLPLFAENFRHLTCLDISWEQLFANTDSETITLSALQKLGTISRLENLQISTYDSGAWQAGRLLGWIPDHDLSRQTLCSLRRLKKFSVTPDVYRECDD